MRALSFLVVCLLFAPLALAQDGARWTHPTGAYSLAPEETGWAILPALSDEQSTSFELVGENNILRMCFAGSRRFETSVRLTQEQVNARMETYTPRLSQGDIHDVTTAIVNGVAVKAFRLDIDGGAVVSHYRVFGLVQDNQVTFNEVSCGGTLPVSPQHQAAFDRFFGSLRIAPGTTQ